MKRLFLMGCLLGAMGGALAQEPVSVAERAEMIERTRAAAAEITSLQCDFSQVKNLSLLQAAMTSEGKMYYKGGHSLRWEYTSPYTYTFVLNGDQVMMRSADKTDVVDVKSSRMFQQIARIMLNSVTGRSLTDTEDFAVEMYVQEGQWLAELRPKRKEMAQLFDRVRLWIDPASRMVRVVELIEKGGDTTRIEMRNVRKNVPIDDAVFAIE